MSNRESGRRTSVVMQLLVTLAVTLFFGVIAWRDPTTPFALAVFIFLGAIVTFIVRPVLGVAAIILLTMIGDASTLPWFPATKNLSSRESILFVSNKLTISPLEVCLFAGCVLFFARRYALRSPSATYGPLLKPILLFTAAMVVGFAYGVGTGGDLRAAIWEVRPLFYVLMMYFLLSNACTSARQYRRLMWTAMVGVAIHSALSLRYYFALSPADKAALEALVEHSSSIIMNVFLLLTLFALVTRSAGKGARTLLLVGAPVVLAVYLISQRRSAILAIMVALAAFCLVLRWRQPRTFRRVVPLGAIVLVAYVGAFWNSTGSAGFPAQAIKQVIAPSQISAKDQSSDVYRLIESYDLNYTIKSSPALGLGFGQKFLRPINLPDISFFEFYEYMPHNSILWIWIKAGFIGFVAMWALVLRAVLDGSRAVKRVALGNDYIVILASLSYVIMYVLFAFVDIAWDAKSMVMLGLCLSTIDHLPRLMSRADDAATDAEVAGEDFGESGEDDHFDEPDQPDQTSSSNHQMQELGR